MEERTVGERLDEVIRETLGAVSRLEEALLSFQFINRKCYGAEQPDREYAAPGTGSHEGEA